LLRLSAACFNRERSTKRSSDSSEPERSEIVIRAIEVPEPWTDPVVGDADGVAARP
jgi:hypothetical protein